MASGNRRESGQGRDTPSCERPGADASRVRSTILTANSCPLRRCTHLRTTLNGSLHAQCERLLPQCYTILYVCVRV